MDRGPFGKPGVEDPRWDPATNGPLTITLTGTEGDGDPVGPLYYQFDSQGEYHFDGLAPGIYTVTETLTSGWAASTPVQFTIEVRSRQEWVAYGGQAGLIGPDGLRHEVLAYRSLGPFFPSWRAVPTTVFGNRPVGVPNPWGKIVARVCHDVTRELSCVNGGVLGEFMLRGDLDGDGHEDEHWALPGDDGTFTFGGLPAGTYVVSELPMPGMGLTTPAPCTVTLLGVPGETAECLFGNAYYGSLLGRVFRDLNGNGKKDYGEPGVPEVTIRLDDDGDGQPEATAISDADGRYAFDGLLPGTFVLTQVLPAGWSQTAPVGGSHTVALERGRAVGNLDFGATKCPTSDLQITKDDYQDTVVPGSFVTYTIVATNLGPYDAFNVTVSDTFPGLSGVTWSATSSFSYSHATTLGPLNDLVSGPIPVYGTITYTATGQTSPTATGTLANTAPVSAKFDFNDDNSTATDIDTFNPLAHRLRRGAIGSEPALHEPRDLEPRVGRLRPTRGPGLRATEHALRGSQESRHGRRDERLCRTLVVPVRHYRFMV